MEQVWGEVRSLVHETSLGMLERAHALDEALKGRAGEELGRYILDHLPTWRPTSPELPYELVREWMRGELVELLGVLCSDRDLVELLGERTPVWQAEYEEFVDIYFFSKLSYTALSYGSLPLSTWAQVYTSVCDGGSPSEFYLWDDTSQVHRIRRQQANAIMDRVMRQEAHPGFDVLTVTFPYVEGLFEDGSTVEVYLTLSSDSFKFSYDPETRQQPLEERQRPLPELVAMFRYFASLEPKDVFLHDPQFDEPRPEELQGVRALEQLWQLYLRLCYASPRNQDEVRP